MSFDVEVLASLKTWPQPRIESHRVVVPTMALYPSGSVVEITIEGGSQTAFVSDGGGAFDEIQSANETHTGALRTLRAFANRKHLRTTDDGAIASARVEFSRLPGMIAYVATSSQDAARHLLNRYKPKLLLDFRPDLRRQLHLRFDDRLRIDVSLIGASNKKHRFDYDVPLGGERHLILDAVLPDSNSINSAVVSHLDLRTAGRRDLEQRIVYDDQADWKSSDLALLEVGAPPVSYLRLSDAIARLAQ